MENLNKKECNSLKTPPALPEQLSRAKLSSSPPSPSKASTSSLSPPLSPLTTSEITKRTSNFYTYYETVPELRALRNLDITCGSVFIPDQTVNFYIRYMTKNEPKMSEAMARALYEKRFEEEEDSDVDDYVESEEDRARVKIVDELIEKLKRITFKTIIPNSYADIVTSISNVRVVPSNDHIISLQTYIRNKNTPRDDFIFNSDRLIRIAIEAGLNNLPYSTRTVETPTGALYDGVQFLKMNCGVSIIRSGEAMEKALRDCCRSIRIGKILIERDDDQQPYVLYSKFPADLQLRKVLLLYPIMSTGNTVITAVRALLKQGVKEANIVLINLFTTPQAIRAICSRFHEMILQTTEVHPVVPYRFGKRYFGTD